MVPEGIVFVVVVVIAVILWKTKKKRREGAEGEYFYWNQILSKTITLSMSSDNDLESLDIMEGSLSARTKRCSLLLVVLLLKKSIIPSLKPPSCFMMIMNCSLRMPKKDVGRQSINFRK
ncbi:unnamed protein product [Eruca vesicaria subsp. sativa]|uniref:Uncharacterized protein n=1 Tax=Eruca vesicaria subsp. sativa TaxID=29727 RepID=A0ABC8LAH2_ERUVS|nr:unnamed protein product [Eruca vesicaria subsp. sativa]